ncbi:MAG: hypothetical protein ACXVY5_04575 [Gaiellales bacterium]
MTAVGPLITAVRAQREPVRDPHRYPLDIAGVAQRTSSRSPILLALPGAPIDVLDSARYRPTSYDEPELHRSFVTEPGRDLHHLLAGE